LNREIPVIADDFVAKEFGTGCVKVTPAHDPNDFGMGQRHNLPQINVMTDDGHMNEDAGPYQGPGPIRLPQEDRGGPGGGWACWSRSRTTSMRWGTATAARPWWSRACRRSGS
jgi:hypothetical protein